MKILIATDSFKDALPAIKVCEAIARGIKNAAPDIETILFPLGDGGEGTAEVLTFHAQGQMIDLQVHDPLFRPIKAAYGISADGKIAFIEMAEAAGLQLLKPSERNPLQTSTFGVGEMIAHAIQNGVSKVLLCIGGSATNDAGIGMAGALGYQFLDNEGAVMAKENLIGKSLHKLERLIPPPAQAAIETVVLCDVDNPLFGEKGAALVYARQKGADETAIAQLDKGLQHVARILQNHFGKDFSALSGAGAAGGLGAGAMAFLNAQLRPGIDTVLDITDFEKKLSGVDLIITGEGRIDVQTLHGKLISGLVKRAKGIPVIALCGALLATPEELKQIGLQAAFSILNRPMNLEEALQQTTNLLEHTAQQVCRLLMNSLSLSH